MTNEIETKNDKEKSVVPIDKTPQDIISLALSSNADLVQVEKLLELKAVWEAQEAKKAYVEAMSRFKQDPPVVSKDKSNKQYNSKYTSLGNLVNTVNPKLSEHGLSASWDIEQNGIIKVTCKLTHKLGHSESASASAPVDTSGSKNAIQQIKSTITYLKAVTFESICGLASTDANFDDDANCVQTEVITEQQLSILRDNINDTGADEAKFCAYLQVSSLESLPKSKFNQAVEALKSKKKKGSKK